MNRELKAGYAFAAPRMPENRGCDNEHKMAGRKLYPKSTRVRLTNEEHARLSDLAKAAGLSISRYLVDAALTNKALVSDEKDRVDALILRRDWAINEVARVGNNLNQVARQLNAQRGSINSESIEKSLKAVATALTQLRRLWAEDSRQG
ncbi:MAG: hypothetical protein DMF61_26685 [Blastocatellia bacterium AA13]|nr:MAG: hypothetical protein DMF61_26685 [Blastocatellia bacterium AA13]